MTTGSMAAHQTVISLCRGAYRRWRRRGQAEVQPVQHSRHVQWLATYAPRVAARFFPDVLWRADRHTPARLSTPGDLRAKTLYLTFDDGPTPEHTGRLLEILDRHDVPASFFLVGSHAAAHPRLVREIKAAGHTVGNHSYTHADAWTTPFAMFQQELVRTSVLLTELLDHPIRWMRPPFGHLTAKMRQWCLARRQKLVMWDTLPADFVPWRTAATIAEFTVRRVRPGSIVVLHDSPKSPETPRALAELLPRLRDDGWQFAAL